MYNNRDFSVQPLHAFFSLYAVGTTTSRVHYQYYIRCIHYRYSIKRFLKRNVANVGMRGSMHECTG